jgi:hypothetical protein
LPGIQQICTKTVAQINGNIGKGAFAAYIIVKMLVYFFPFLVLVGQLVFEVRQKIHFLLGFVDKSKLFIYQRQFALRPDCFVLFQFFGVNAAVYGRSRIFGNVNAQILAAAHFHCARVADWRVKIEVKRDFSAR